MLVDRTRVEVEDLGDHSDLGARAADRLADVLRLDARQIVRVVLDERREAADQARAVCGSDGPPRGERRLRAGNRRVGLLDAGVGELGDCLLGRGVDDCGHRVI